MFRDIVPFNMGHIKEDIEENYINSLEAFKHVLVFSAVAYFISKDCVTPDFSFEDVTMEEMFGDCMEDYKKDPENYIVESFKKFNPLEIDIADALYRHSDNMYDKYLRDSRDTYIGFHVNERYAFAVTFISFPLRD